MRQRGQSAGSGEGSPIHAKKKLGRKGLLYSDGIRL